MMRALWTAASGMQAQEKNIDVVAKNLANVNTTGFKRSRADFEDLMYQNLRSTGAPATNTTQVPTGIQIGLGTRLASVSKLFTTGDFSQTGNELDIAIEGDGFFQIQMPDGTTAYSRAGAFKKDDQGRIVTPNGDPLLPEIVIPNNTTKIEIGSDGTVSATQSGQTTPTTVGTIQLALFANPAGLFSMGKNLYKETDSSGTPVLSFKPVKNSYSIAVSSSLFVSGAYKLYSGGTLTNPTSTSNGYSLGGSYSVGTQLASWTFSSTVVHYSTGNSGGGGRP